MMATAITTCEAGKLHTLAGWLCCGSHQVVSSAGVGGLAGHLRGALLLSEVLMLVPGAAIPAGDVAHPMFLVAFLLKTWALVYIQLADTHLDPWVAGHVPTSSDELLVLFCSSQQQRLYILLWLTLCLDRKRHRLLIWWRGWGQTVLPWLSLGLGLGHRGSIRLAQLRRESRSCLRWVFRIRRRWSRRVAYNLFIVRKLAVIPEP